VYVEIFLPSTKHAIAGSKMLDPALELLCVDELAAELLLLTPELELWEEELLLVLLEEELFLVLEELAYISSTSVSEGNFKESLSEQEMHRTSTAHARGNLEGVFILDVKYSKILRRLDKSLPCFFINFLYYPQCQNLKFSFHIGEKVDTIPQSSFMNA